MSDLLERLQNALAAEYSIERELGGGMSRVFVAQDVRLDRQVVLKVLPPEFAGDVNVGRFKREVRLAARLQHPHIVPLLAAGSADGLPYYVMPYVEGESLRTRIRREKELPLPDVIRLLREVLDALQYAHARGVVHRDIKPDNILLTDHHAVVTDFGVAKAVIEATSDIRLTSTGIALGTPAYMAPEQIAGEPNVDHRADIYATGALAFEMVTGFPPFRGATIHALLAAHMAQSPPSLTTLRQGIPPALDTIVLRCLEKRPADRWQSAVEITPHLDALYSTGSISAAAESPGSKRRLLSPRTISAVAGVAVMAVATLIAAQYRRSPTAPIVGAVRAMTFEQGVEIEPSFSPDGRYVAYAGGTPSRIYLRQQGSRPISLIVPDSGPPQFRPRFSPDGTRIAFDARRRIFVIPALGGVPQQIVADGWSPTWAPDGERIAYAFGDTIFTTYVNGGRPVPLATVIQPAELAWSPDGRWIAVTSGNDAWDGLVHIGNIAQSRILLIAADDGGIVEVTDRSAMNVAPTWSRDSRQLLFISNRAGARDIYAVRLGSDGRPIGAPARLSSGLDAHSMALSAAGDQLVYARYHARVNIWSLRIPSGAPAGLDSAVALTTGNQMIESISVSPDRRWVYFTSDRAGNSDIWRMPLAGGEPVQLTRDPADEFAPEESPDGEWLAFYSIGGGTRDLWVSPTGSGERLQLTDDPEDEHSPHWSPDGQSLCYSHHSGASGSLRMIRRQGSSWSNPIVVPDAQGAPNRLLGCAGWLPDGRHMVVQDPERTMIALLPVDGGALQIIYSGDPGQGRPRPVWVRVEHRTGTIYFRDWVSIWALEPGNTVPRQIVRFDDPSRRSTRIEMDTDGQQVFFSLGDPQSDLFLAELSGLSANSR